MTVVDPSPLASRRRSADPVRIHEAEEKPRREEPAAGGQCGDAQEDDAQRFRPVALRACAVRRAPDDNGLFLPFSWPRSVHTSLLLFLFVYFYYIFFFFKLLDGASGYYRVAGRLLARGTVRRGRRFHPSGGQVCAVAVFKMSDCDLFVPFSCRYELWATPVSRLSR